MLLTYFATCTAYNYVLSNLQQEAHDVVSKRKTVLRENKLSSGEEHNLLQDVVLTYKGDRAPRMPSSEYDSFQKLNLVIKGWSGEFLAHCSKKRLP